MSNLVLMRARKFLISPFRSQPDLTLLGIPHLADAADYPLEVPEPGAVGQTLPEGIQDSGRRA